METQASRPKEGIREDILQKVHFHIEFGSNLVDNFGSQRPSGQIEMVIPDLYDLWLALFWTPKPQSMHRHWYILHPISHWYPMFRYPEYSLNIPHHIISHHITLFIKSAPWFWELQFSAENAPGCGAAPPRRSLKTWWIQNRICWISSRPTSSCFSLKDFKGWFFKNSSWTLAADSGNTKLLARTPPSSDSWGCQLGSANDEKIGKHMETS